MSDVGASLVIALLDYDGINPVTRLVKSRDESLAEAVDRVRRDLRKMEKKGTTGVKKAGKKVVKKEVKSDEAKL